MNELQRALLEAHVAHELSLARETDISTQVANMSARLYAWFASVKLDDVLSRDDVLTVIDRYVIELRIGGGITELAGQMSLLVFASEASARTRLEELLPYESYKEYADKIESLTDAQRMVVRMIAQTEGFRALLTRGTTLAIMQQLFSRAGRAETQPSVGLLDNMRRELGREVGHQLEELLTVYFERHAARIARDGVQLMSELLQPEALRSIADELWQAVGGMRLAELFSFVSMADLEDFIVVSYETWLKFRKSAFFRTTCEQVVDAVFGKYGGDSMQSLLDDLGFSEAIMRDALQSLFGRALAHAGETGLREQLIRERLEAFYRSDAAAALLAGGPAGGGEQA